MYPSGTLIHGAEHNQKKSKGTVPDLVAEKQSYKSTSPTASRRGALGTCGEVTIV
jgi:hypothetical protein